jgi:1-acyl-sn-glycerol-3-phosphate acyltransferase
MRVRKICTIREYQDIFEGIVNNIVETTINNFSVSGIENLNKDKSYLFISNHRDITLDSALLNLTLHQNGFNTTNNAVGNNLLSEKWASDLMRLNRSFIIDRSDKSKKDIYKSLFLASEFIAMSLKEKNESIWIAQKQGRSKDGIDFTDPSVLKMIHLSNRKTRISEFLNSLSVVPVSISYEKDPNDILKAKELYLTSLNTHYNKEPREDLQSISDGITGQKGDVHLSIGEVLEFNEDCYDSSAKLITDRINSLYKCHATNEAACVIQGLPLNSSEFTEDEIEVAMSYLKERLHFIEDAMQPFLLKQYSNSNYKL